MPIEPGEPFSFDQALPTAAYSASADEPSHARVVILGAGLAGLTCGYRYAQTLGRPVTRNDLIVLEREPSVGGRVRSLKMDAQVVDLGAVTFQPSAYPRYMTLLDELGLRERVRTISRRDMTLGINGRVVYSNDVSLAWDGVAGLVGRGLFTPGEAAQLLRFYFYLRRVTSPAHFDELLALHDRSVADWAQQFGFSERVRRKFIEPFIGFTFSTPECVSAAFGVLLLGSNLNAPANLAGGMMQVPEALAKSFAGLVETGATVVRVERAPDGFITAYQQHQQTRRVHSKFLVVALPANIAALIFPEMRERAGGVRYGSGRGMVVRGALRTPGKLQLWRTDRRDQTVIYGGKAQPISDGAYLMNLLTYRGELDADTIENLFRAGQSEQIVSYSIHPAVAVSEPKQKPLPLDWGDGLYMAGDCTGLFPSQETAVSSGEQVAQKIAALAM